ncbi:MAG: Glycogen phosphorylase [uncultured Rubrobacteraceae bacterium]|uniref:Glycogen phosphorylase n=1 Tax=uncultured Rubrobacteraceae bacterium TaxID=349277 RepID=A0A6J4S2Z0_9ACTN|nr:MAG: Glycogen phosphorylase [uncultured Rubrobacteraceae bacterium]
MQERIPEGLNRLPELARNILWTWRPQTQRLFSGLDPELWETTEHNPVRLLHETKNLQRAAEDPSLVALYELAVGDLDRYLEGQGTWTGHVYPRMDASVAYFSAEFGLHESLPIYSGGLGVLAGDHVKSASDLGLPLVGVGILYAEGYFRQRINAEGRQEEVYEPFEPEMRPISPAVSPDGAPVVVKIGLPGRDLHLKVWQVEVGRTRIYLLDANLPQNAEDDRLLTARLYGGGQKTRISQEMILGIGGVRALRALGLRPNVYHMNEGHAAFLGLERIRELVAAGESFEAAAEKVARSNVFTTHTPVPAGHDAFPPDLFDEFAAAWPEELGTDREGLWALGRKQEEWGEAFNMTVLAFSLSRSRNAVSKLHRDVSLEMWSYLFPESSSGEAPITDVTNGVHTWSWLAPELSALFDRHAGGRAWRREVENPAAWSFVASIPPGELWRAHEETKRGMARFVNHRLDLQKERTGRSVDQAINPDALTIGFSRRFATYKRATLLLSDPERLRAIIGGAGRPVQFVFAGKAHPADEPAKAFIAALYRASEEDDLAGSLVILEDYDMNVTRRLVQGVDVWLNNPRRPLEASGTSGQKASLNGAPNFSVLDGWWPEAYNGKNGWAIGEPIEYGTEEEGDRVDAESLYSTLESSLVPLFYDRDEKGVPLGWVRMMKEAIQTIAPTFSTQRMVQDYVHKLYVPRANRAR